MKLVMTLMVRDEADIVGAMLEHHYRQGVDHVIATDNASVDGTTQILESFAERGLLTLHHDPRHLKQQSEVVTGMAREAFVEHGATWVLNADADEFWVAENSSLSLREAFEVIPTLFRAFNVPVIDMTGDPALDGSGLGRLVLRDQRPVEIIHALGLHAHATHDVVHVGDADVVVAQGNHFVNIESEGRPETGAGIEVLHLPWRSWRQFRTKVENAGLAYDQSNLTPSPNHHGMRDYRRLRQGSLYAYYLARHPAAAERADGDAQDLRVDDRLARALTNPIPDQPVSESERRLLAPFVTLLASSDQQLVARTSERDAQFQAADQLRDRLAEREERIVELNEEIGRFRNSRVVRMANALGRLLPGRRG